MKVLIFLGIIVFIICLFILWYSIIYNKFQEYIIRINESEADIDATLRKRFDLLNKSIEIIKNITKEEEVLNIILDIRSKKLNNFELDRQIYEAINEFENYKEINEELRKNENFIKIDISLNESEAEMFADRKYYNDIITEYNKLVTSIPSNIIAKVCKFKTKKYYDGKKMTENGKEDIKL